LNVVQLRYTLSITPMAFTVLSRVFALVEVRFGLDQGMVPFA
jgi:hypothetical protein